MPKESIFIVAWPKSSPRFNFKFHAPGCCDHIHDNFLAKGLFYEEDLLRFLASLGIAEGCIIDVGAYVGNHSVFFAGVLGRDVISIEANPDSFSLLCKNIELNKLSPAIVPLCIAAADRSGNRMQKGPCLPENQGAQRLICQSDTSESTDMEEAWIESVALDSLGLDSVALIKVDVEGMELDVLEGLSLTIQKFKPVLAIECMTALEMSRVASWCHKKGYLPITRKAATPILVFSHSSCYEKVCHGCSPPAWNDLVP